MRSFAESGEWRVERGEAEMTSNASEKFDYTEWQRRYFDSENYENFIEKAAEYEKTHPYSGNAKVLS